MEKSAEQANDGRVALITGANTGIGRITAIELACRGYRVFLACRSWNHTRPVLEEIRAACPAALVEWLPLELGDHASIRACAKLFLVRGLPLHLLVNNAGLAGARGLTRSGFEMAFGVNHMGHFVLTRLLRERLIESAPARVVTVASRAHTFAGEIDWAALRRSTATWLGVKEYAVSKLANVLFSADLGRQLQGSGVTTYAVHPGVIDTDIWRRLPGPLRALNRVRLVPCDQGAGTTLYCALAPRPGNETGLYYSDCRPVLPSEAGQSRELAAELWNRSEAWAVE